MALLSMSTAALATAACVVLMSAVIWMLDGTAVRVIASALTPTVRARLIWKASALKDARSPSSEKEALTVC